MKPTFDPHISESPLDTSAQEKKTRAKRRSRLEMITPKFRREQELAGNITKKTKLTAANNPLRDLQEKMIPEEDGSLTTLTLPIQDLSRKVYDTEMMRGARLDGLRQYLKSIDIEQLKSALVRDDSDKALDFLCALLDPANRHLDPAAIAMRQKIPLGDLMAIWRNDRLSAAMGHLYEGAPKVAEDAVLAAQNVDTCCPRCEGLGEIWIERGGTKGNYWLACPNCKGKGTIIKLGDHKAREMVLKATGIIKGAATGPHITINTGQSAVESVLDELDRLPAPITVVAEK